MTKSPTRGAAASSEVTALSVEFVATPRGATEVQSAIPAAISGAMKDVKGFAGCVVMIAEQEARLVTVITFWNGEDRAKICADNARWVYQLLSSYIDRCLRVQTLVAHLPVLPNLQQASHSDNSDFIGDGDDARII
jgi:hypothetical protein